MKNLKTKKGITLVALIITIIVMLILAGVTLSIAFGENGIFSQSKLAIEKYEQARQKEAEGLESIYNEMLGIISSRDDIGSSITGEQLQALIQQIEAVKQENSSLKTEVETLKAENKDINALVKRITDLESEKTTLNSRIAILEAFKTTATNDITALQNASSLSINTYDATAPSAAASWIKVWSYKDGYNESNTKIIHAEIKCNDRWLIIPFGRDTRDEYAWIDKRTDGIYLYVTAMFKEVPVKLTLQKIN